MSDNKNEKENEGDIFEELKKEKQQSDDSTNTSTEVSSNTDVNTETDSEDKITINSLEKKEKVQRSFYISPQQDRNLEKLKARTGRDKSELVRIALDYMFENVEVK